MLYSFRLLLFLINIDQTTVLNWIGGDLKTKTSLTTWENITTENSIDNIDRSVQSLKLLINSSWQKIQDGLELADIENIIVLLGSWLSIGPSFLSWFLGCFIKFPSVVHHGHEVHVIINGA